MSNKIRTGVTLNANTTTNGFSRQYNSTVELDWTTVGCTSGVAIVGTSEEDLSFADVASPHWMVIKNLDLTNFVTYGPKSGGSMIAFGKLMPGETHLIGLDATTTLRWKADTTAVKVEFTIYEV